MYKILLIGSLLLSGCASYYVIENYNGFVRIANGHIDSELMESRGLQEEEVRNINEEEDMYVYVDIYSCKFGYIVDRNDPDKKIKSWVLFQNKESCNMLDIWRIG